jgi:transcriptional regulator with XRE-family HTH domain
VISPRQFGSSLRRQRERQNITVKMLEARTKISASLLTGLEKGDCSRWPAGIYSRAWIRAYAEAVGLDPEITVAQFAACFAETAFPDAPARTDEAAAEQAGLRLGLDPDPGWRVRVALSRAAFGCIDFAIILLLAGLAWVTGLAPAWTALALAAIIVHIAGVAGGVGSATAGSAQLMRAARAAAAERQRARARESTLAEAA